MPTKQAVLDDVQFYSAEDLYQLILEGVVTFDELLNDTEPPLAPKVRMKIQQMIDGGEEEEWQAVQNLNTESAYQSFIASHPGSHHCIEARNFILALQNQFVAQAFDDEWSMLDKTSKDALKNYLAVNPDSVHSNEARAILNEIILKEMSKTFDAKALEAEINRIQSDRTVAQTDSETTLIYKLLKEKWDNGRVTRSQLLEMIRVDHNLIPSGSVYSLIENGYLTYDDLLNIGIDPRFIQKLADHESLVSFTFNRPIDRINKMSTEIYFWGIPSSGKSCALGAILSVAANGRIALSMAKDNDCQGYGYMTRLAQLFQDNSQVGLLPQGTEVFATHEMGFDLEDFNHAIHPITCIDLAGELVRCMFKSDAGDPLSLEEQQSLDTLTRILIDNRSVNRKVHFFVLEYGGENRKYEGLVQKNYLDAALQYISRTRIFQNDTDAVFLMVTKVDKIGKTGAELNQALMEYIMSSDYQGFYQGLKTICRVNDINGGTVEILPFSLGEVCFRDYCIFNDSAASMVVKKILDRSKGFKNGKLRKFLKK